MDNDSDILWTAGFLNERFIEPVSPLGWSYVGSLIEQVALRDGLRYMGYANADTIPATRLWHGHPYANLLVFQILYNPFPEAFLPADAIRYFPNGDVTLRERAPYPRGIWSPRFLVSLIGHALSDPLNVSPFNYWQWQRFARKHEQQITRLNCRLQEATAPVEFLEIAEACYALDIQLLRIHRWSLTYADLTFRILADWCKEEAQTLISQVPSTTRTFNQDLYTLSHAVERSGLTLDVDLLKEPTLAQALYQFLNKHGHRAYSLDFAHPSFRDDPTQVLPLLSNPPPPQTETQDFLEVRRQAAKRLALWQQPLFPPLLFLARRYAALREDQRYAWEKSLAISKRAHLRLGEVLVAQGVLATRDDITYATRQEIAAAVHAELPKQELRTRVEARRVEWQSYTREHHDNGAAAYPLFLKGDQPFGMNLTNATPDQWRGRGVSPGLARGTARVIHDPHDLGRVANGDILVAPATDPAWTPVFARLAGLALERGGILSHAAVVAREYHLPAVTAIPNLTEQIQEGEWIEVDGGRGIVRRVGSQDDP